MIISGKRIRYLEFFQVLKDILENEHQLPRLRKVQPKNWYSFGPHGSSFLYGASFSKNNLVYVNLCIDTKDRKKNEDLFDALFAQKSKIESELGFGLEWRRKDSQLATDVRRLCHGSIEKNVETLANIRTWMADSIIALIRVFRPRLTELTKIVHTTESHQSRSEIIESGIPAMTTIDDVATEGLLFEGTDVPVEQMFKYLEEVHNLYGFLDEFPQVSMERALAAIRGRLKAEIPVHSDRARVSGMPVFKGSRVPVRSLFNHLSYGYTIENFLEMFPTVEREQAIKALEMARDVLESISYESAAR